MGWGRHLQCSTLQAPIKRLKALELTINCCISQSFFTINGASQFSNEFSFDLSTKFYPLLDLTLEAALPKI